MANGKVYCADCRARDRFYRQYPIGTLKHNPDVERSKLEAPVAEALRALIPGERFATQQSVIPVDLDLHPPLLRPASTA